MHARLYDESRHVGKFQRDHRPRVLRQTKGAWPRTVIFCRIYGAPSFTALLQNAAREQEPRVRTYCTYHRRGNASFLSRVGFVASNYRETGRAVVREMAYEGSVRRCNSTSRSDCPLVRIKSTSLTLYCIVCHTCRAVIFPDFVTDFSGPLFNKCNGMRFERLT